MADGMTVKSVSARLLQKLSSATDHLCQIVLKSKIIVQIQNGVSHVKAKSRKNESRKTNLPVVLMGRGFGHSL